MGSLYKRVLTFAFLTLFRLLAKANSTSAASTASENCSEKCGNLTISYPFGVKDGCFRIGFKITCNETTGTASTLDNLKIIDISISEAEMRVYGWISYSCNYPNGIKNSSVSRFLGIKDPSSYSISHTRNKFTVVGCQTLAYIFNPYAPNYDTMFQTGCLSLCTNQSKFMNNSTCTGIGCCKAAIPKGLTFYNITFDPGFINEAILDYSPCSFAFVAEDEFYTFLQSDTESSNLLTRYNEQAPVMLDWVLGKETCEEAKLNKSGNYACVSSYSSCIDSKIGYTCICSQGFEGNPYIHDGCTDVDECKNITLLSQCYGKCTNLQGSYKCTCPDGYKGNPNEHDGCQKNSNIPTFVIILIVGFSSILFTAVLYTMHEKVMQIRAKKKCFRQNGGLLLQSQINAHQSVRFKIYSVKEITKATNKFNENSIVGRGGQGIVYRGIIDNNRKVAIKKSIMIDAKRRKVFAKEMYVLSLINHKNVIQILGCCLEVEVPILVYEYIPRGTLYQRIQSKDQSMSLSFRLKVATETASVLAYLHTDSHPSIIHGDIKSSNILLDENDVTKVSDFGASMFPLKEVNDTGVPGTFGYLDPESLVTGQLTAKSDVFSFGVVLLELLTRMKAVHFEKSGEKKNLSLMYKEDGLERLLDDEIKHIMTNEQISELSELLTACLKIYGDERPKTTKIVAWLHKVREYDQNLLSDEKIDPIILTVNAEGSNHSTNVRKFYSSRDRAALESANSLPR